MAQSCPLPEMRRTRRRAPASSGAPSSDERLAASEAGVVAARCAKSEDRLDLLRETFPLTGDDRSVVLLLGQLSR